MVEDGYRSRNGMAVQNIVGRALFIGEGDRIWRACAGPGFRRQGPLFMSPEMGVLRHCLGNPLHNSTIISVF